MAIEVDAVAYDSPTVEGGAVDLVAVEAGSFDVDTLIARATEGIEAEAKGADSISDSVGANGDIRDPVDGACKDVPARPAVSCISGLSPAPAVKRLCRRFRPSAKRMVRMMKRIQNCKTHCASI